MQNKSPRYIVLFVILLTAASLSCGSSSVVLNTELPQVQSALTSPPATQIQPTPTLSQQAAVTIKADGSGDYPDLPTAVANLNSGSTITLDPGTYILAETLVIDKTLTILGAGPESTFITSSAPNAVLVFAGNGDIVLQGINFTYTGTDWSYVVRIEDGGFDITNCSFSGGIRNQEQQKGGNGLHIRGSGTGTVKKCLFKDNQHHGLVIAGEVNFLGDECTAQNNLELGMGFWNATVGIVRNSESLNNKNGFGVLDTAEVTFEGNIAQVNNTGFQVYNESISTFVNNKAYQNEEAGFSAYDSAQIVARNNDSYENGYQGFSLRHESIGTFENNRAYKNEQSGFVSWENAQMTALYNESYENVQNGFVVEETSQATLEYNKAYQNGEVGFISFGESQMTANYNESYENGYHGFSINESSQGTLENNKAYKNGEVGFISWGDAQMIALNNESYNNATYGFYAAAQSQIFMEENSITDNGKYGIRLGETTICAVSVNTITGNSLGGIIMIDEAYVTLYYNKINNNIGSAIAFYDFSGGEVVGNTCSGNTYGIEILDSANPSLDNNTCQ